MIPRWHILLGAIFTAFIWLVFPETAWYNLALIFLSAFLIDFDHYICAVWKTGKLGLFSAFAYHKKLQKMHRKCKKKGKGDFHIFHTVEFHLLVFALGFLFEPFFYVFAGMVFHSLMDVIHLIILKELDKREFFLVNWLNRGSTTPIRTSI